MACDGADPLRRLLMLNDKVGVESWLLAVAPLCWKPHRTKIQNVQKLIQNVQRHDACRDLLQRIPKQWIALEIPRRCRNKSDAIDLFMSVARNWHVSDPPELIAPPELIDHPAADHRPAADRPSADHRPAADHRVAPAASTQLVPHVKTAKKLRKVWKGF